MDAIIVDRRGMLAGGAIAAVGGLKSTAGMAQVARPTAPAFTPFPIALPFAPASLGWLSEKLIVSHHDNNYGGAIKRLGQIHDTLAATDPATTPGFTLNGLKREELLAWNSMILHELYFAGLGQATAPARPLAQTIERDFGSYVRWAAEYAAMGKALGGGSGWVLLMWSPRDKRLTNQWASDHTMTLAGSVPILALDMYEHSYHIDFGAKAGAYVDGYMKAIDWTDASARFRRIMA